MMKEENKENCVLIESLVGAAKSSHAASEFMVLSGDANVIFPLVLRVETTS